MKSVFIGAALIELNTAQSIVRIQKDLKKRLHSAICRALKKAVNDNAESLLLIKANLAYAVTGDETNLDLGAIEKRIKEARKKQKETKVKEIQLTVGIGQHDMDFRAKMADRFLSDGNSVKIVLRLRGREKAHPENGITVVENFISMINSSYKIEKKPAQESFNIIAMLAANE